MNRKPIQKRFDEIIAANPNVHVLDLTYRIAFKLHEEGYRIWDVATEFRRRTWEVPIEARRPETEGGIPHLIIGRPSIINWAPVSQAIDRVIALMDNVRTGAEIAQLLLDEHYPYMDVGHALIIFGFKVDYHYAPPPVGGSRITGMSVSDKPNKAVSSVIVVAPV